jgi:hypothetical protein
VNYVILDLATSEFLKDEPKKSNKRFWSNKQAKRFLRWYAKQHNQPEKRFQVIAIDGP